MEWAPFGGKGYFISTYLTEEPFLWHHLVLTRARHRVFSKIFVICHFPTLGKCILPTWQTKLSRKPNGQSLSKSPCIFGIIPCICDVNARDNECFCKGFLKKHKGFTAGMQGIFHTNTRDAWETNSPEFVYAPTQGKTEPKKVRLPMRDAWETNSPEFVYASTQGKTEPGKVRLPVTNILRKTLWRARTRKSICHHHAKFSAKRVFKISVSHIFWFILPSEKVLLIKTSPTPLYDYQQRQAIRRTEANHPISW